jgi:hypothetical protein
MLLRCAPLDWQNRSLPRGRLHANFGPRIPRAAPRDLDAGGALRWRLHPILGATLLFEEAEKHRNYKKRARQEENE